MNKKIKCSIHITMTAYFSFDLLSSLELSVQLNLFQKYHWTRGGNVDRFYGFKGANCF